MLAKVDIQVVPFVALTGFMASPESISPSCMVIFRTSDTRSHLRSLAVSLDSAMTSQEFLFIATTLLEKVGYERASEACFDYLSSKLEALVMGPRRENKLGIRIDHWASLYGWLHGSSVLAP